MFSYGVCSSYKEYRRFKKSAAKAAVADLARSGISNAADGLVQGVVDNFDADISSQNGKQSTHSLAVLLTQYSSPDPLSGRGSSHFKDQKSSEWFLWGPLWCWHSPLPWTQAARDAKIPCYKDCPQTEVTCPHSHCREESFRTQSQFPARHRWPRTTAQNFMGTTQNFVGSRVIFHSPRRKVVYLPLIDMKPSDPDTMLTAMMRVKELTAQTGQTFSILTCDQQLYRVAVQISWDQPETFKDMYLRLGGMHALMSFVGAIGSLMTESGLSDVLSEVFGGDS